jgi:hypothetical protein
MLLTKEQAPTLSPSIVFTFGFIVESIKELGVCQQFYTSWHTSSKRENKTLHHNLTIEHIMYKVDISNMITQVLLNKNKKQWYEIMKE